MPDTASKDGRWTRLLLPGGRYYLLALAFFVVVFGVIPLSIYAHSGEDWGFPLAELLSVALFGLALFIGCAVLIRLVAALHVPTASTSAIALFCLGVFLLLAHVYAPIQIGPLDGAKIESAEPTFYTVVELGFLAMLVLVFFQLRRGRGLAVAASFSVAAAVVGVCYASVLALSYDREVPTAQRPTSGSADIDGNVYHIVLDAMQTDAFLLALEQTSKQQVFDGFVLFENNISNYTTTSVSSKSYFTGTMHEPGRFRDWAEEWSRSQGLLSALSNRGYKVWMYSPVSHWRNKHVDRFWWNVDIYEQETGAAYGGLYDLIHIWLAGLAPNPMTNEILPLASAARDQIFEWITGEFEPPTLVWLHSRAGVQMLRRLSREETLRAPNGQYVYAHAGLPHSPFVVDRNCRYVGKRSRAETRKLQRNQRPYLAQAQCAVLLVAEFFQELKRLGRYDAATIVVHGDHGQGFVLSEGAPRPVSRTLGHSDSGLLSLVSALLMIKRPDAAGPLEIVNVPTQLVDVFPTVLDILDLEPSYEPHGRSVYSIEGGDRREARFAFDPIKRWSGKNITDVRIDDPSDLRGSSLTVLGPANDPASARAELRRYRSLH